MSEEDDKREKEPWIWKAAIVALPLGLALSAAIAMAMKISQGEKTGMEGVSFSASNFEEASLRDAVGKIEDLIGPRDFESKEGQQRMKQMISLLVGSLSSINLGYQVESDRGESQEGRIWKNYWVDSSEKPLRGTVLVWTNYADESDSASVAALLSVAEWMRGREFDYRVRIAFVRDEQSLPSVAQGLSRKKNEIRLHVSGLGRGSAGFSVAADPDASQEGFVSYHLSGEQTSSNASDWKLTTSWESFENQVRQLCQEVSRQAGEQIIFSSEKS